MARTVLACCLCILLLPDISLPEGAARKGSAHPVKSSATDVAASRGKAGESSPKVAATAPASVPGSAAVEGRVKLPETKVAPVKVQRYTVVSKGGAVAMSPALAVVYLEGATTKPVAPPKVQMVQKDFTFIPALLPVQTGTTVEFPNLDDTYHNVFSYSKAKRFDLGRYLPTEQPVPSQVFDKPGLVQLHCDIHEHMRAVILVLDTPYFAVTNPDGSFRLTGLPAGKYALKAWLGSTQTLEVPVELKGGNTFKADFP